MDSNASKSLVADYESSSEDDSVNLTSNTTNCTDRLAPALEMLDETMKTKMHSVFTNPYKEIETYEQAILEKHVKMTTVKELSTTQMKPCYKFYKGKCGHGEKCNFSHDTPIYNSTSESNNNVDEEFVNNKAKHKKRCGLKNDLIPPKKFMKIYNKTK